MGETKTSIIEESKCFNCNSLIDRVSSYEGKIPKNGDVSVCIKCGNIAQFKDGVLIKLTTNDMKNLKAYKKSWKDIKIIQAGIIDLAKEKS